MQNYSTSDVFNYVKEMAITIPSLVNYTVDFDLHVGELKWTCRTSDHNGWLVCDGRQLLISDYPFLFQVIGTSFGGDGITNFNLPDVRSRVPGAIGSGSNLSVRTLGQTLGEETHTLITNEIPSHLHTGTTDAAGQHNHGGNTGAAGSAPESESVTNVGINGASVAGSGTHVHSISTDGTHTHTFTTNNTGGGQAHNNMQPTIFIGSVVIFTGFHQFTSPA